MSQTLNILITGGAGFIGSHLCDLLLAAGHRVIVLDDLSTGSLANVAQHQGNARFELITGSVLQESLVETLVQRCDRVFHLASAVGVKLIMDQPVKTIETIFCGTDVVLRCCARRGRRVLITSTSEVYGKGVSVPFKEDDDVLTGATGKHRWAYACAKALDEFLALAHYRETKLPVAIARLFNTVGPRQTGQYGMVVPRFVSAAVQNEPIEVHGDGEQTRSFAHVLDVAGALIDMLDTPECFGKVVNIGNDVEVTINQLAQAAIRVTGSSSKITHRAYDEVYGEGFEDMRRRVPSLERARQLLNYVPRRMLDEIISDVAAHIRRSN